MRYKYFSHSSIFFLMIRLRRRTPLKMNKKLVYIYILFPFKDKDVHENDHHHRNEHHPRDPFEGENGSDDFVENDSHIKIPDIMIDRFNQHVHPAIPHMSEQVEEDVRSISFINNIFMFQRLFLQPRLMR